MLTTIYGCEFGTQEGIHWVLCNNNPRLGPEFFEIGLPYGAPLGKAINDNREFDCYHDHEICMQRMENYDMDKNYFVDFMDHFRKYEKDYDNVLWANYYGRTKDCFMLIKSDKLILCNTDFAESFFYYVTGFAHKELEFKDIDNHSEIWWFDHHHVDGKDTTKWKEYWYKYYHDKMKKHFIDGKLKYFWQLNFAHWDLHKSLAGRSDIDPRDICLRSYEDPSVLWDTRILDQSQAPEQIQFHREHKVDFLEVKDPCWFDQIDEICDYVGILDKRYVYENLNYYAEHLRPKKEWFEKMYGDKVRQFRQSLS